MDGMSSLAKECILLHRRGCWLLGGGVWEGEADDNAQGARDTGYGGAMLGIGYLDATSSSFNRSIWWETKKNVSLALRGNGGKARRKPTIVCAR